MTMVKAYTSLEQSKKLAEILPPESADMKWYFWKNEIDYPKVPTFGYSKEAAESYKGTEAVYLPCWSLAALFTQIPSDVKTKDGCNYTLEIEKCDAEHIPCGLSYHDTWGRGEDIITHYYDNFIDACYEMIMKLHEQKLI